jgi:hypothetical protein
VFTAPALRRLAVRAVNAGASTLAPLGLWSDEFREETLLDDARRRAGLDDFGSGDFHEALRILCRSLAAEGRLTPLGRLIARRDILSLLVNRLHLARDRRRNPGIAEQEIRRPLFIVGLPRTGSTLLHHLLAQDPGNRVAQTWEVMAPSPPPERERYEDDPRIARAAKRLRWLDVLAPEFKKIHAVGAQLALECIAIMSHTFLSPRFHTTYHVPAYQRWLDRQSLRPAYVFHRQFLQHLQWRTGARRWVLKAPSHLFGLDVLFESYPDAVVIQTHRDPVTVLASVASLTAVLQHAFADRLDLVEIGDEVARRWADGLERAMQVRQTDAGADRRFVDVQYQDLVRDPIGALRRLYARLDMALTEAAETRMERHLAENPKDKNGPHRYSLKAFGLEPTDLGHRFKAYREFFRVESEPLPAA